MLKERIDQDLKKALLAGNKVLVETLRGLKSAILYEEVGKGVRDKGLSDEEITTLLAKEAKKRQDSADLYLQGGSQQRADAELAEKQVIESYLPQQLSDEALIGVVDSVISGFDQPTMQGMGQIIASVKAKVAAQADGARIARMVKERLQTK